VQKITSDIRKRSEHICEWCGAAGDHRESRKIELTLCDACNERFADPPYPVHGLTQLRHNRVHPHSANPISGRTTVAERSPAAMPRRTLHPAMGVSVA
jgi:hypothetical protein